MSKIDFTPLEGYRSIAEYTAGEKADYEQFDRATQSGLNLFALREDYNFNMLEETADLIIAAIPSIKRIFAKPIIRLRDSIEIVPAEAVRTLDSKSLANIAVHSEQWENIEGGRLKPRKLMTIRHEDDYAIYENIVFVRLIDEILHYVSLNLSVLRNMLYANRELKFNLLERENHPLYFLALGKLHIGYLKDYDKYRLPIGRCYEKLNYISGSLKPRLSTQIYKVCKKKSTDLQLKKTNIFRAQKDYRKIYCLKKHFIDQNLSDVCINGITDESPDTYFAFCSMISVFAAGHFNFKFDKYQTLDFNNIDASASFSKWKLTFKAVGECEARGILLTVSRDRDYRILLVPSLTERAELDVEADEIITVSPSGEDALRICLYDIESFRRIQQILLRAMIYSDELHTTCPFCGKEGVQKGDAEIYECGACRTIVSRFICRETGKIYYRTDIAYYKAPAFPNDRHITKGIHVRNNDAEAAYKFRNITPLDERGRLVCPICKKSEE